jgi:hypothetical protein
MRMSRENRAYLAAALMGLLLVASGATQAQAAPPDVVVTNCMSAYQVPNMVFDKGSAPNGQLRVYYSKSAYCGSTVGKERRKVTMPAGSGNGTTNDCTSNKGWLPNGSYKPRYEKNHQTSSAVVKGSVWSLGNKKCTHGEGVTRTELFIHSQGGNGGGWAASNYKSEGCVKINQTNRTYLAGLYNAPIYGAGSTTMTVTS